MNRFGLERATARATAQVALAMALVGVASGQDVLVQGPVATSVQVTTPLPGTAFVLNTQVQVPADAPFDLGIGGWATDKDGHWFQRCQPGVLAPGKHQIAFSFTADDAITTPVGSWSAALIPTMAKAGIFFWTTSTKPVQVSVASLTVQAAPPASAGEFRLTDVALEPANGITGKRWSLHCLPQPLPGNPYDPDEFAVDLVVHRPDGVVETIPGFWDQPMVHADGGDRELVTPSGTPAFCLRYRPRIAGHHRLKLVARWAGQHQSTVDLTPLEVSGPAWDGYVRMDAQDNRFFARQGAFTWPVGINLRSITDLRGGESTGTIPTPERGTLAYDGYLTRLAAHGVDLTEIWMSAWNLALEWDAAWPGFHGAGRYNQNNAWRLDRILDLAETRGVAIQLVINNHGQGATEVDREWAHHPYNKATGGWLASASELFTDARARRYQERLRRYLVARYADHPALFGWKLWTEIDLTEAGHNNRRQVMATWHQGAAAHLKDLDTYDHPIATHWSGNYRNVWPEIASLTGLDYLTIDAYHQPEGQSGGMLLGQLLMAGLNRGRNLSAYQKPVVVSEFGGDWNACPLPQLEAEHASGGFCALVSGYAAAPLLWWFEWVDQGARYAPYQALRAFTAGEDLRGADAQSVGLTAFDSSGDLWARAWVKPGRMLGYVMDPRWQAGASATNHAGAELNFGKPVNAGVMDLTWWDADRGIALKKSRLEHAGGTLTLRLPEFARHLAFKLVRVNEPAP